MTIPLRPPDELQTAPHMATLPVLSASIAAFSAALEIAHPEMCAPGPTGLRDAVARLLCMYLDACHELLHEYDRLTFDVYDWSDSETEPDDGEAEPDDDIPF